MRRGRRREGAAAGGEEAPYCSVLTPASSHRLPRCQPAVLQVQSRPLSLPSHPLSSSWSSCLDGDRKGDAGQSSAWSPLARSRGWCYGLLCPPEHLHVRLRARQNSAGTFRTSVREQPPLDEATLAICVPGAVVLEEPAALRRAGRPGLNFLRSPVISSVVKTMDMF